MEQKQKSENVNSKQPSYSHSSNSNSLLMLIILGLIFVIIVMGYLLISKSEQKNIYTDLPPSILAKVTTIPTPTIYQTESWKKYTNTKYKFEFMYPSDWEMDYYQGSGTKLSEKELSESTSVSFSKMNPDNMSGVNIAVSANQSQMGKSVFCSGFITDPDCIAQYFDSPPKPKYKVITLDQIPAIQYLESTLNYPTIVFVKNKTLIRLSYSPDPKQNLEPLSNQILSTFKFFEQTQKTEPTTVINKTINYQPESGWTNFTSELGFTFQYPPEYTQFFQNPIGRRSDEPLYCQFGVVRLNVQPPSESIDVRVLPYTGGSRRQFAIEELALTGSPISNVQEVQLSNGIRGLILEYKIDLPNMIDKIFAGIFIVDKNAIIISNLRKDADFNQWYKILQTLKVDNTLHVDTSKCPNSSQ